MLAAARHDRHASRLRVGNLLTQKLIRLAKNVTTLAVADQGPLDAAVDEHLGADLACVGPFGSFQQFCAATLKCGAAVAWTLCR